MNEEEQVDFEKILEETPEETRKPFWKWIVGGGGLLVIFLVFILIVKTSERAKVKEEFRQVDQVSAKVFEALFNSDRKSLAKVSQENPQSYCYDNEDRFVQIYKSGSTLANKGSEGSVFSLSNVRSGEIGMWAVEDLIEVERVSFSEDGLRVQYNLLKDDGTSASEAGESLFLWKSENRPPSGCLSVIRGILVPCYFFPDGAKESFAALAQEYPQNFCYDQDSRLVQVCNRRSPSKNELDYESVLVLSSVGSTESVETGQWMTQRNLRVEGVAFVEDEMRVNCALLSDEGTSSSQKREYRIPWKKGTDPGCGILCRSGEILSESSAGNKKKPESVPADSI